MERWAAFAAGRSGGNPAGVVIGDALPAAGVMQGVAAELGYSETAFAAPDGDGWRVRYFAPALEVPFCGHATVALGAALARRFGDGCFPLRLNAAAIRVEGWREGDGFGAALVSPGTRSRAAGAEVVAEGLALFGLDAGELDPRLAPAFAEAGARHLVLALRERARLAAMRYDMEAGRRLMLALGVATISLVVAEGARVFHARNAFAAGGVYEDPATGAAAAALGGLLRDAGWAHGGALEVLQGWDMGVPCRLLVGVPPEPGAGVRVAGAVRVLEGAACG